MENNNQILKLKNRFFVLLLLVYGFTKLNAATCVSVSNGDWNTAATWSCGHVPACGDSIVVLAVHTVTITNQQNYSGCNTTTGYLKITIYGKLQFQTGSKLTMPCNSRIYIMPGGDIEPGNGGGSSNYIEICNDKLWSAANGPLAGPSCLPSSQPGCGQVLPIELVDFGATLKEQSVEITWSTASEKNNSHFEVERSQDANNYAQVAKIPSKAVGGNSSQPLNYEAADNDPLSNTSYYRLKQVDLDGIPFFSKIVSVNVAKAKNLRFMVYPNPNNGEFTVDISGLDNNHEVLIGLRDANGQVVYESSFYLQEVSARLQIIPSSRLPKGVYTCTLVLEEIEYSVKVVIT